LFTEWGTSVGQAPTSQKRDYKLSGHLLDLSHTFSPTLYSKTNISGIDFEIDCDNCGAKGGLEISGNIETSWGIPKGLTVTATPQDIEIDVNLKFDISGKLVSDYKPDQLNLFNAPLPGFGIPEILDVGPIFSIDAGLSFSGIEGDASIEKGITAKIDNSAVAELNILGSGTNTFSGWTPTVSTTNLTLDAEISATLELYTQLSVDIGLQILGSGFGAGISLKVPDVNLALGAEYNNQGACPGNKDVFGVKFDGGIGVDLNINAYTEKDDVKTVQFQHDLYNNPNIFGFPSVCLPFGGAPKVPISGIPTTTTATTTSKPTSKAVTTTTSGKSSSKTNFVSGKVSSSSIQP
jgi:hypothetical protein